MRDRERPLDLYGPPGLSALFQQVLRPVIGRTSYPLDVVELEHHEEVGCDGLRDRRRSRSTTASRPTATRSSRTTGPGASTSRPRAPSASPKGPDFGRLQRGETVNGVKPEQVVGEDRPGRRIVYTGDTAPVQSVEVYAHGADVLVHEATFCEDERARARETGHSTAAPGRPDAPRTRASSCSRSRTSPRATSRARSATRRARSSRTRSSRATSTRSRSRSRNAASRTWSRPVERP